MRFHQERLLNKGFSGRLNGSMEEKLQFEKGYIGILDKMDMIFPDRPIKRFIRKVDIADRPIWKVKTF